MTKELTTITQENAPDVIKEIQEAFYDIPFDNSRFQNENFVIASQITPERAYRAIGLRMYKKLIAVQENIINQEKQKIEIEEHQEKINNPNSTSFEIRKAELDLKLIEINKPFADKLFNDALEELNTLYKHFKALPKYTREEFEAGEYRHYLERNKRGALGINGHREALLNIEHDLQALKNFEQNFAALPESKRFLLQELTEESMTNLLDKQKNDLVEPTLKLKGFK